MKSPYVSDLEANQLITATFLVLSKDIRQKKTGEPFLSLVLGDRTGDIEAKMWDNVGEVIDTFDRDDFIKVKGALQVYQNRPQLTIHKMVKVEESAVEFEDYFPVSKRDPGEMYAELTGIVAGIGNPHLRALLEAFFADEAFAKAYRTAPAAKSVHHAFLGGLIEHVLSLCELSKFTAAHYGNIDLDLLLTGVVLHDAGKLSELTYERSFGYSDEGQLLGHIVIGLRMLEAKMAKLPDFPAPLRTLVEHMVVSHHGELAFGSPKLPQFPEAMLLHQLDNLDSKMECMRAMLEKDANAEKMWTPYFPPMERSVLKKDRFLGAKAPEKPLKAAPAPVAAPVPAPKQGGLFGSKLQDALAREK